MVPNMMSMKQNRTMMSNMIGSEFKIVETNEDIPGIELIVLSGLRILITLTAEMFYSSISFETQPKITTKKSSYTTQVNKRFTYNVPCISEVGVCSHEKTHGQNLEDHLNGVNDQKYLVNFV